MFANFGLEDRQKPLLIKKVKSVKTSVKNKKIMLHSYIEQKIRRQKDY